jgi:uncharacterized membrane protein
MYTIVAIVIAYVIAQSIFFLIKAWRRAKELGMEVSTLKKTVLSSALFTVAPAVSILIGVISLSKFLGFPLPWLRLSVIGSLTYEFTAATTAASAIGASITQTITDPKAFAVIAWVMTLGIMPSLLLVPLLGKKIASGIVKLKSKDNAWGEIFLTSLFLGMISAFLGVIFATIHQGLKGWIPVFVMITSALIMAMCGIIVKKLHIKWVEDFALPISMLGAMALSIPITNLTQSLL